MGPCSTRSSARETLQPFSRIFPGITFAMLLAIALTLAPQPAFAQHGGGGGGGHAGGGGGHAGGGHSGGGGGPVAGAHGGAPVSHGGSAPIVGSSGATSARGYTGAPGTFVSAPGARSNSTSVHFVGGNNRWQNPPNASIRSVGRPVSSQFIPPAESGMPGSRATNSFIEPKGMRGPLSPSTAMRGPIVGVRPARIAPFPPRRFQPIFFFGGGCFNGFFPGLCGSGFFFGSPFWGYGFGCDPFWGCPANYYGGFNNTYYNGGGFGGAIYDQSTDTSSISQEFNPSRYAYPPEESSGESASGSGTATNEPEVVLFLKDGSVYALTDYWVAGGKLHYVTSYGGENSLDLDKIDIQRTVDVNSKRGIDITLKPAPEPRDPDQQPAPAPDQEQTVPQQ